MFEIRRRSKSASHLKVRRRYFKCMYVCVGIGGKEHCITASNTRWRGTIESISRWQWIRPAQNRGGSLAWASMVEVEKKEQFARSLDPNISGDNPWNRLLPFDAIKSMACCKKCCYSTPTIDAQQAANIILRGVMIHCLRLTRALNCTPRTIFRLNASAHIYRGPDE